MEGISKIYLMMSLKVSIVVFLLLLFLPGEWIKAQAVQTPLENGAKTSEEIRALAEKAFSEAEKLINEGTAESRKEAIKKYGVALELSKTIGDRQREAITLNGMAVLYASMGELRKALGYCTPELQG